MLGYSFRRGFTFHGLAEFLEFSFSCMTAKSVVLGLVRAKLTTVLIILFSAEYFIIEGVSNGCGRAADTNA